MLDEPRHDITRVLAHALSTTRYQDLPARVIADTQRAVLDWLGSALAGSLEPPAVRARAITASLGSSDDATVFPLGRSSAAGAAFANGVASHILELDDIHKASTVHAAAPVIPAALAIAEREHATGEALLLAVALGYDAALRIGEAVNPSHYRFWHPTGTVATLGAAVAAASITGLDAEQMVHALGSAGTQAAGLWEFNADGAMSKHLHPGKAAMNGIIAADLARTGFTGASRILEGERGFIRAMSDARDTSGITRDLGARWLISENCFKVHACCGHTHTAIDAALALRSQRGWQRATALADLRTIHIDTYGPGYAIVSEPNPSTPYRAKFSLTYCVAVALLEGRVGLEQFSTDRFDQTGVRDDGAAALLARMRVQVADDLTGKYPAAWPARIRISLRDGTELTAAGDYPRGNPENPVSTAELEDKFRSLIAPRFGDDVAARALDAVRTLPECTDVARLFATVLDGRPAVADRTAHKPSRGPHVRMET
jgi:2-methylcitrate dehydratase PrpD